MSDAYANGSCILAAYLDMQFAQCCCYWAKNEKIVMVNSYLHLSSPQSGIPLVFKMQLHCALFKYLSKIYLFWFRDVSSLMEYPC